MDFRVRGGTGLTLGSSGTITTHTLTDNGSWINGSSNTNLVSYSGTGGTATYMAASNIATS